MTRTEYNAKVDWLSRAFRLDRKIDKLTKKIDFLKNIALGTCVNINPDVTGGGFDGSKIETKVVTYVDLEDRRDKLVKDLADARREISAAIDAVDEPTCYAVLVARYLSYEKWEQIAEMMNQSFACHYVYKVHRKAVRLVPIKEDTIRTL